MVIILPMTQVQRANLLALPDELLGSILVTAAQFEPPNLRYYQADSASYYIPAKLAIVCRRFYNLIIPYLYTNLSIRCNSLRGDDDYRRRTQLIHRTLRQDPLLWPHCRKLSINTANAWGGYDRRSLTGGCPFGSLFYVAQDLITWLKGIRELCIRGSVTQRNPRPPDEISSLLRLLAENLPALKVLRLQNTYDARYDLPLVHNILNGLVQGENLRILDLCGVSGIGSSIDWKLLEAKAGTASFTTLRLRHFIQSAEALKALVKWSRGLESFSFSMPSSDYYSGDLALSTYSLRVLHDILVTQKATLSHIEIYEIYSSGIDGFDLSNFENLQSLWLSHDLTGTETALVSNLIAPNLRVFDWDMALEDQQCCVQLEGFSQPEEDWLRALASGATKSQSALNHIRVHFTPETYISPYNKIIFQDQYPWDRMDTLAEEILPHGIRLTYNTPNIARDEFLEALETPEPEEDEYVWDSRGYDINEPDAANNEGDPLIR